MGDLQFTISAQEGRARTGLLKLKHGVVKTPELMPVATQACVKALTLDDLIRLNAQMLICNTYHLMQRPGGGIVSKLGGLHKFMNWNRPLATDSGGYQVFSLGFGIEFGTNKLYFRDRKIPSRRVGKSRVRITDNGVYFKTENGLQRFLSPEESIRIQEQLGADMILAFDECTCPSNDKTYTEESLRRTHSWAVRCLEAHKTDQALAGIVQGGEWKDLREESARYIASLPFDSYAIGGSLGKTKKRMHDVLDWVIPLLDEKKPVHLLGIGVVEDIFESVDRGVDLFDCVTPTRQARFGFAYLKPPLGNKKNSFKYSFRRKEFAEDSAPLDPNCNCETCSTHSRAYIHHLHASNELLAHRLVSYHNLHFYLELMREIREAIDNSKFHELKREWGL